MSPNRGVLTTRGRAFVAAGLTLALGGLGLGLGDLTRVGVLLVVLPLLAALLARRTRPDVLVSRDVTPPRLVVGQSATVQMDFENASTRATSLLLADERMDPVLGDRPRFVLPRMEPGERRRVTYAIRSRVRGRHRLGPVGLRVRDPFGLTTASLTAGGTTDVLVLPRVEPLGSGRPRGEGVGAEGEIPHMVALHGEDDVSIRAYRDGDDLRRIHWPATAHQAELMVRQEDRPARRRAVIVLDSRRDGHQGAGWTGSFEWSVTAVASVAAHLGRQGYAVHLLSDDRLADGVAADVIDVGQTMESLALAEPGPASAFAEVLRTAHGLTAAGGLVVAVVSGHDEEVIRQVASLREPGGTGLLMLVDGGTFAGREANPAVDRLANIAGVAGWSVSVVRSGDAVPEVWAAVTAPSLTIAGYR